MNKPISVVQEWVQRLSFMQQSVLLTAIRGPDGLEKNHVSKLLIRWLRRCVVYSAFESKEAEKPTAFNDPVQPGGGSFTGPSISHREVSAAGSWQTAMNNVLTNYLETLDGVPHHFQLHFMHAAEIIGYKHPDKTIQDWWGRTYSTLANDMHLDPEPESGMDRRLGDFEATWREAEIVTARGPAGRDDVCDVAREALRDLHGGGDF